MPTSRPPPPLHATVEIEEDLYSYTPANNGAGPFWCHGNTTLARFDDQVFATGLETIPAAKPLNNCRWTLWRRGDRDTAWEKIYTDTERTREPSPLTVYPEGRLFVSANPARTLPDAYSGPAEPQILEFDGRRPSLSPISHLPRWMDEPSFTEHSYRSFVADSRRGELLLLQNIGYNSAFWSFLDAAGAASSAGELVWPWGADYAKPVPIRICYPNVALVNRAVHVFGVSDIEEPNPAFREFKFQLTGNKWDYDFRRLFYSWTPEITRYPFRAWAEIASREATCGWLSACDLCAEDDGRVHLLWHDTSCNVRLREKFFPDAQLTISLEYAVIRDGQVLQRQTLAHHAEGADNPTPLSARFHPLPDGRLGVIAGFQMNPDDPSSVINRIFEIRADGSPGEMAPLDLKHPFKGIFFTATPRAGSKPSPVLDLLGLGHGLGDTVKYARVRITSTPPRAPPGASKTG